MQVYKLKYTTDKIKHTNYKQPQLLQISFPTSCKCH